LPSPTGQIREYAQNCAFQRGDFPCRLREVGDHLGNRMQDGLLLRTRHAALVNLLPFLVQKTTSDLKLFSLFPHYTGNIELCKN
jgi:hypothetical protein